VKSLILLLAICHDVYETCRELFRRPPRETEIERRRREAGV
jgi:hypothetical protein